MEEAKQLTLATEQSCPMWPVTFERWDNRAKDESEYTTNGCKDAGNLKVVQWAHKKRFS